MLVIAQSQQETRATLNAEIPSAAWISICTQV